MSDQNNSLIKEEKKRHMVRGNPNWSRNRNSNSHGNGAALQHEEVNVATYTSISANPEHSPPNSTTPALRASSFQHRLHRPSGNISSSSSARLQSHGRTEDYGSIRNLSSPHSHYSRPERQQSVVSAVDDGHTYNNRSYLPSSQPHNATTSWQTKCALAAILIAVVLERLSFYAFTGNLVLFLNKNPFYWESYNAMDALFVFFGVAYIMSIVGGWAADSSLGRFTTMVLSYLIYILGYAMLPFISAESDTMEQPLGSNNASLPWICGGGEASKPPVNSDPFKEICSWQIFLTLIVIAMGSGSLKANLCPFGSDQLGRASQATQLSFFNWYYWCINIGSFIGLGFLCYLEQQYSFRLAFIISASMLFLSGLVFSIGRLFYTVRPPDGSVLTNVCKILREAIRRWRQRKQASRGSYSPLTVDADAGTDTPPESRSPKRRGDNQVLHFLDYAKHQHGGIFHGSLVDDVKKLGMIITVFAVLIPYWIVYFQMQTTFLLQGLHMRLDFTYKPTTPVPTVTPVPHKHHHHVLPFSNHTVPADRPQIVAAWFSLFDALFVIMLLPLFDRVIYPRLSRAGRPVTFTLRIVLGMVFAMAAMLVAGVVEHYRLKAFWPYKDMPCLNATIQQYIAGTEYDAADMSVFWQIPQYALIGMSEVFTSVACLQFAVSVAPKSMKALITGIFYFFSGMGSFLGTAVLASLASSNTWILSHDYGNINCRLPCNQVKPPVWHHSCHLDYYFYSLACLEGLAILLFLLVARKYGLGSDRLVINAQTHGTQEAENRGRGRHVQAKAGAGVTSATCESS